MRKIDNRAQSLGGLYGGILVIASIGMLIAILLFILYNVSEGIRTPNVVETIANESDAWINSSGYTLVGATSNDFAGPVITYMINSSDTAVIADTQYSLSSAGVVTNATATVYPAVNVSYYYTYSRDTTASNATDTILGQFVNFLPWLGIILLVLAAGVVLFFVIRSFAGSSRGV